MYWTYLTLYLKVYRKKYVLCSKIGLSDRFALQDRQTLCTVQTPVSGNLSVLTTNSQRELKERSPKNEVKNLYVHISSQICNILDKNFLRTMNEVRDNWVPKRVRKKSWASWSMAPRNKQSIFRPSSRQRFGCSLYCLPPTPHPPPHPPAGWKIEGVGPVGALISK